jgi:hypothetical protein
MIPPLPHLSISIYIIKGKDRIFVSYVLEYAAVLCFKGSIITWTMTLGMFYVTYIACNVYYESILESDLCDLFFSSEMYFPQSDNDVMRPGCLKQAVN